MRKGEIKIFSGLFTSGRKKLGGGRIRTMRIAGRYGNIWIGRSSNHVALYIPAGSFAKYGFTAAQERQWGSPKGGYRRKEMTARELWDLLEKIAQ